MSASAARSAGQQGEPVRRSAVALWALAAVVVVAVVLGAVVGALRDPVELDPHSPQGVVQAYVTAVLEDDHATAEAHLSAETAERCEATGLDDVWVPDDLVVTLEDVRVSGGEAEVRVRLREPAGPPLLGGGGFTTEERFHLRAADGTWRLTDQPWPFGWCPEGR